MASPCFLSDIKDPKLTQEERVAIWKYAKDFYVDQGVTDISTTISGVAKDLGLRPEWVADTFAKPKSIRTVSNELYKKMSDRRTAIEQAKDYVQAIDTPAWKKFVRAIYNVPFSVAVAYHGTVGGVTHAGSVMFRPTAWREYWTNFAKQAPLVASKGFHEAAMQGLTRDENFVLGKRAGLATDPNKVYTDYEAYAKYLGVQAGRRGFDALKLLRQEMFNREWEKISATIKSDPQTSLDMAKLTAENVNHATGALSARERGFIANAARTADPIAFAARLEASRWARIIGDPIKTADTFLRWKYASAPERHIAMQRVKHAAEFTATFVGSLVANQALLSVSGSKDKINFTDPSKSDWLKHKVAGHTVMTDGGLLAPVRLLSRVVYNDLLRPRKELRGATRTESVLKDIGQYSLGKVAPTVGIVKELVTGETFAGRLLPWSQDTSKKPKMTWNEWAMSHAPIPLSGATREAYDSMRERGMTHLDAKALLKGLAAFGVEMTGTRVGKVTEEKPKETVGR